MALHLNLHYEIENARRARKRDPLKLSLWGLCAIAACFASYYFFQLAKLSVIAQELASKKAAFAAIEPKSKKAKQREDELSETKHISESLVQRIEGRFYWAPLIEELVRVVPREVQITKLAGDVQGDGAKKCKLSIDGLSAGADPRKVAEELRTTIAETFGKKYQNVTSNFRSLEDGVEMVQLDGRAWPTAVFAINVELQSGAETAAAPVAPKTKKK
jgi:hypothetical protein